MSVEYVASSASLLTNIHFGAKSELELGKSEGGLGGELTRSEALFTTSLLWFR